MSVQFACMRLIVAMNSWQGSSFDFVVIFRRTWTARSFLSEEQTQQPTKFRNATVAHARIYTD